MSSRKSTYFFIGTLSDYTAQYQVQNFFVNKDFVLEVFMSGIAVWGSSNASFDFIRAKVIKMLDTIIASYIFKTNKVISYRLERWVETRGVISRSNMIGWMRPVNTPAIFKSTRSTINTPWKKAAKLYPLLTKSNPNYEISLRDYNTALAYIGDDSFFFAYRALEDICRAVTGYDDVGIPAWTKLHKILDTSKSQIDPLMQVSTEIRHGKKNSKLIRAARKDREKFIKISHTILEKAFKREFPSF